MDLTGTWNGTYSGAFSGTFVLTWTQTGNTLSGKIQLSSPPSTRNISGTVSGSSIQFGSAGGIAYTGTVSGNSMSGSYGSGGLTGTWSATKAS